jgi:hypothetical protein
MILIICYGRWHDRTLRYQPPSRDHSRNDGYNLQHKFEFVVARQYSYVKELRLPHSNRRTPEYDVREFL